MGILKLFGQSEKTHSDTATNSHQYG